MRELFEKEILRLFEEAKSNGKKEMIIISGDVHRKVGGYPGKNHRMPTCCDVMKSLMNTGDEIIFTTKSGQSARLEIKYFL